MTDQKPSGVSDKDWQQTPSSIRAFVLQSLKRIEQFEAQRRGAQMRLEQSTDTDTQIASLNDNSSQAESGGSHGGTILVVDDNEMNRDLLSRRLIRQGYLVDIATNGREALEMLKEQQFDLLLLDIMMPEMNGYEVLEYLQADPALRDLPVIMVTAVDDIESVVRCIKMGAEDYLFKPFNPVLLKARIGASLEKKWLRDQQAAYMLQLDIENKRKSDELEQARQFQLSMLPTAPPRLPHLDIAARQETASEVGGDYYDFFPQTNGKLRVAIGDATGHGAASGLMVSMTKASLLATNEPVLATLFKKINTILNEIYLGTQLNMALLLLEFSQMQDNCLEVKAIAGGVPPIYVLRTTGNVEEMLISALPLGIIDDAAYQQVEFSLNPGDTVLLMSDGLSEMSNAARELLGYDRLIAALQQIDTIELTADEILQRVAAIGEEWATGHPLYDDVTLVVIKVK